ncbi:M15 family metallopeptidase [Sandaracinus amylolyticus]|nr:M15 family metallopeptidase [Sandaracinus amylolyticus]
MRTLTALAALAMLTACQAELAGAGPRGDAGLPPGDGGSEHEMPEPEPEVCFVPDDLGTSSERLTIGEAVGSACSTSVVRALSEQLVQEIQCLRPGSMARIDDIPNVRLGSATFPWMQRPAADALRAATSGGGTLSLNSTLRTLPQQYLLYRWYRAGRCGISLAAAPGRSNHESGLALDTSDHAAWRSRLEARSFRWLGGSDPVHFEYVGGGTVDLSGLSVLAFQKLWNRNHPEDLIDEDGLYGPQTEARLARAPSEGFPIGARCDEPEPEPEPEPMPMPMAARLVIDWRLESGTYVLTASTPEATERVEYTIDGRVIGTAIRAWGADFAMVAGTCEDHETHVVEAIARDAASAELARAVGLLEASGGTAIAIRPRGASTYEITLERAASEVAALEVEVDGFVLTDEVSGATRSERLAVRYTFTTLGARTFVLRSLDASGGVLAERTLTFELR